MVEGKSNCITQEVPGEGSEEDIWEKGKNRTLVCKWERNNGGRASQVQAICNEKIGKRKG